MLKLYSNIKRLRKLHNMSQQELAEAVGYKGKSMIAQVENGRVDLSASMISKFARVFEVSELSLMGLTENAVAEPGVAYLMRSVDTEASQVMERIEGYTPEEITRALDFLDAFQKASPDARAMIDGLLKSHQSES